MEGMVVVGQNEGAGCAPLLRCCHRFPLTPPHTSPRPPCTAATFSAASFPVSTFMAVHQKLALRLQSLLPYCWWHWFPLTLPPPHTPAHLAQLRSPPQPSFLAARQRLALPSRYSPSLSLLSQTPRASPSPHIPPPTLLSSHFVHSLPPRTSPPPTWRSRNLFHSLLASRCVPGCAHQRQALLAQLLADLKANALHATGPARIMKASGMHQARHVSGTLCAAMHDALCLCLCHIH